MGNNTGGRAVSFGTTEVLGIPSMELRSLLLCSQGSKNGPNSEPVWTQSTFPSTTTLLSTHHTSRNSLPLAMSELIMENSVDYKNIYLACTASLLISALS